MNVSRLHDYVIVRHKDGRTICVARLGDGNRLHDISFPNDKDRKCNRTRQAAMNALQTEGYR